MNLKLKSLLLLFLWLPFPTNVMAGLTSLGNVVFIGDSITEASALRPQGDGDRSWRYDFWMQTVDRNIDVRFVGSRTGNLGGNSFYPTYKGQSFENRHEAIFGTRASERVVTLAGQYGDLNQDGTNLSADTAFILVGCNDVRSANPPLSQLTGVRDNIRTMVHGLRSANNSVDVFVISILPRFTADTDGDGFNDLDDGRNDDYKTLNGMLAEMTRTENQIQSRVGFIDIATSASPNWFYDGIHPNSLGESNVGQMVFEFVATPEPSSACLFLCLSSSFLLTRRKSI